MADIDATAPMSRRTFTKGTIAGAALAASSTGVVAWFLRGGRPVPFELEFAEDLNVWIGSGERFPIEVRRGTEVVERYEVTSAELLELDSPHLRVREITAPVPAVA